MPLAISAVLDRFNQAFNRLDLDAVMTFFAADAEYLPGDGTHHRGLAAIRRAFAPQFAGAFGAMRFDVEDELVDEGAGKAAVRWVCRHDLGGEHGRRVRPWLRALVRLRHGSRVRWHGVDVFRFDAERKITGKYTYAGYDRPRLERDR